MAACRVVLADDRRLALMGLTPIIRGRYQQLQKLLPLEETRTVLVAAHIIRTSSQQSRCTRRSPSPPSRTRRATSSCWHRNGRNTIAARSTLRAERCQGVRHLRHGGWPRLRKIYKDVETAFASHYREGLRPIGLIC